MSTSVVTSGMAMPLPMLHPRAGVTVVIAAWRAAGSIGRSVASALAQPEAVEVVVVDDASNDGGATIAAAKAADDGSGRLIVMQVEQNSGPARARNVAIANSKAPWICVLDSDDFMEPGRLAALLALTARGYDFIADDLLQTSDQGDFSVRRPMWFSDGAEPVDVSLAYFLRANLPRTDRWRRELGFIKPLMRRDFLDRYNIRYDETMRLGEDYDLYLRALAAGARFRLIPAAGYIAVMRPDSLSARHDRKDLVAFHASDLRLLAMDCLTDEEAKLLRAHRMSTERRIATIDFMGSLKTGRVFRALSILLREPKQTAHVLNSLAAAIGSRLSRGKK